MNRPSPEVTAVLARASNTLLPWVDEWRQRELDQLPFAGPANVAVAQGRCQMLTELRRILQDAPSAAMQPSSDPSRRK